MVDHPLTVQQTLMECVKLLLCSPVVIQRDAVPRPGTFLLHVLGPEIRDAPLRAVLTKYQIIELSKDSKPAESEAKPADNEPDAAKDSSKA